MVATATQTKSQDEESQNRLERVELAFLGLLLLARKRSVASALRRGNDPQIALREATQSTIATGRQQARNIGRAALSAQLGIRLAPAQGGIVADVLRARTIATAQAVDIARRAAALDGNALTRWTTALKQTEWRAAVTAATEPWHAAGQERNDAAREAAADRGLRLIKRWNAERDEHTCDLCWSMHGIEVPAEDDFPGGLTPGGVHARCHCWEEFIESKREQRPPARPVPVPAPIRPATRPLPAAGPSVAKARPAASRAPARATARRLPLPRTPEGDARLAVWERKQRAEAAKWDALRARNAAAAARDRAIRDGRLVERQRRVAARRDAPTPIARRPARTQPWRKVSELDAVDTSQLAMTEPAGLASSLSVRSYAPEIEAAVRRYTGGGYGEIRALYRERIGVLVPGDKQTLRLAGAAGREQARQHMAQLDKLFDAAPAARPEAGATVYRGAKVPKQAVSALQVGETVDFGGVASASFDPSVALRFANRRTAGEPVVFRIQQRHAVAVDNLSAFAEQQEREVLLRAGSRYRIEAVRRIEGRPGIIVDVVEQ
jgi:hypothetical protein